MKKYGYLPEKEKGMDFAYTPHALHTEALKKMQEFAGLAPTGHLDAETKKVSDTETTECLDTTFLRFQQFPLCDVKLTT